MTRAKLAAFARPMRTWAALVGLLLQVGPSSAQEAPSPERPNILWLSAEDMSPALGAYGDVYATTPHLDALASKGLLYTRAYAPAPICAPARSGIITGVHATSLGTQHLRSDVPIPDTLQTLPELLRARGYFTTNNAKTDYNFSAEGRWDALGPDTHWRDRPEGAPFFSVINFMTTHEGRTNNASQESERLAALPQRHDPAEATLPPHLPDTPEMRRIWARAYDLATAMDAQVGEVLRALEADGLAETTVVFFWSDHGWGLPRYKRWNYSTGLHVPLLVYAPPAYRHLLGEAAPGEANGRLVSLIDLAPTTLSLADVRPPSYMQGVAFLGPYEGDPHPYVVGARDRADDVYDLSRAVIGERYLYVRNYLPHRPYVRRSFIFGDQKASYRELNRLRAAGELPEAAQALFEPRPLEELYDLRADPHELVNLAERPAYHEVLERMRTRLRAWIIETRDTGFLHEAEMMRRAHAQGSSVLEMARDTARYDLPRILAAAEQVGDSSVTTEALAAQLRDGDSGVRFWAATSLLARGEGARPATDALLDALDDAAPSVQVTAAEALCALGRCDEALPVLARHLEDEARPWVALHAARTITNLGPRAAPLLPQIQAVREKHSGDKMGRYKDWLYSMFIGFALDQALSDLQAR